MAGGGAVSAEGADCSPGLEEGSIDGVGSGRRMGSVGAVPITADRRCLIGSRPSPTAGAVGSMGTPLNVGSPAAGSAFGGWTDAGFGESAPTIGLQSFSLTAARVAAGIL